MNPLEKAISIAVKVHQGQKDKADMPYILHPLRVMLTMNTDEEMQVAVLHDVLEDTNIKIQYLYDEGFSEEVIQAVETLTKRKEESYDEYISRVQQNELAQKIKLADIEDNMNIKRFKSPDRLNEEDIARLKKYHYVWDLLKGKKNNYLVFIEENFPYRSKPERYVKGTYKDCENAIQACKEVINDFLIKVYGAGKTADELLEYYRQWGEDAWIMEEETEDDCNFSSWEYLQERIEILGKSKRD